MDFINKIGQRRLAKLLFVLAILICAGEFILKKGVPGVLASPGKFAFAIALFAGSSGILSLAAHKTREFRMISIVLSASMIFVNAILFYLGVLGFLFAITVGEIIFAIAFTLFVSASYKKQKEHERKLRKKTRGINAKTELTESDDTEIEKENE
jgi:Ca2+/Na+ antiporter